MEFKRYLGQELSERDTIISGHFDNLKIEETQDGVKFRYWLSRMTVADGAPYENQVLVQTFNTDTASWEDVEEYRGGVIRED